VPLILKTLPEAAGGHARFAILSGKTRIGILYRDGSQDTSMQWHWRLHGFAEEEPRGNALTLDDAMECAARNWRTLLTRTNLREIG
jgi:hypothetical protein